MNLTTLSLSLLMAIGFGLSVYLYHSPPASQDPTPGPIATSHAHVIHHIYHGGFKPIPVTICHTTVAVVRSDNYHGNHKFAAKILSRHYTSADLMRRGSYE